MMSRFMFFCLEFAPVAISHDRLSAFPLAHFFVLLRFKSSKESK